MTKEFLLSALLISSAWAQDNMSPDGRDLMRALLIGRSIDGVVFTPETKIDTVAFNTTGGDAAFIARWRDAQATEQVALFTTRGLVARVNELIDGHYLAGFSDDTKISINSTGHVAYAAWYSRSREAAMAGDGSRGIWLDRHLVATHVLSTEMPDVKLDDDGYVTVRLPKSKPTDWEGQELEIAPSASLLRDQQAVSDCWIAQNRKGSKGKSHSPEKSSSWACRGLGVCGHGKPLGVSLANSCSVAPAKEGKWVSIANRDAPGLVLR